jgi:hypothetical protein
MRRICIVIVAVACSACANDGDRCGDFEISSLDAGRGVAVTQKDTATVHIDRYPMGPNGPNVGTAVLVFRPDRRTHTLEALDPDGDGHWDAIRYLARKDGALLWIEDNDADGVIDSITPAEPPENIRLR